LTGNVLRIEQDYSVRAGDGRERVTAYFKDARSQNIMNI
jgi:hypothetical protein